jgi:Leucine-rich repeat (LRR) protein
LAQKTYVPDDAFEQALINLDLDSIFDDSVYTSAIDTVQMLYLSNDGIADLTGIEAFTALADLFCNDNQLTELDLSNNPNLFELNCRNNLLTRLDVRNGNNLGLWYFTATLNPDLYCIDVDEVANANANWEKDIGCVFFTDCFPSTTFDCTDSLELTNVIIDNANFTINIAIYNGFNYFLNYPYVAFTIDANGDTIQYGNINLFGASNFDTTWYNYSLSNVISPTYPLTSYFVYSDGLTVTDTCILTYNLTPTAIIDINASSNRKLISIVDLLGRESKGTRNEPLLYIYEDGTVEKKIIIE